MVVLRALLFIGGGGGGGFFALDGGGGGACFFPFGADVSVEKLVLRDGAELPCEVAGEADLSLYDRSGLLLLLKVDSSEGSLKRSFSGLILDKGRSCAL